MKLYIPLAVAALLLIAAALLYAFPAGSAPAPKKGRVLTAQWSEYEKAELADRPKKMLQILNDIKKEAIARHLPVDFYVSGQLCVEKGRQLNWKQYDSLKANFSKEVQAFDDPLVTFIWGEEYGGKGRTSQLEHLRAHAVAMQKTREPALWGEADHSLESSYDDFITNDYEYALWRLVTHSNFYGGSTEYNDAYKTLSEYLKDSYPGAGRLEYFAACQHSNKDTRIKAMRSLADKYKGKAISLFPREDILEHEFDSLEKAKAPEKAYRELYARCKDYLKEMKGYTGDEKKLISSLGGVSSLSDKLTGEHIGLKVLNDSAVLYFRNVSKAVLVLYELKPDGTQGKELKRWNVENSAKRFYLIDKEHVALPNLNDGNYRLEMSAGSDLHTTYHYSKHTLSLAIRRDNDAHRFYAADYITGEPLEAVKLILYKGNDIITEETVTQRGFTALPKGIVDKLQKTSYYSLRASYKDAGGRLRLSNEASLYNGKYYDSDAVFSKTVFCNIYKDKGAYNPDDVMHFKAVLFKGDLRSEVAVLPAGEKVEVLLKNASGKQIASRTLTLTEFGSVSGEFLLERGERNGYYSLTVRYNGKEVASDSFRVDDFILPTFTVRLEKTEDLLTAGDTVTVKGVVESFSGHSLTSAKVTAKISHYGTTVMTQETEPAADGSFTFHFVGTSSGSYLVDVTVTDGTGETAGASKNVYIVSGFSISARLANKADATAFLIGDEERQALPRYYYRPRVYPSGTSVIHDSGVEVVFSSKNNEGALLPIPISWKLYREPDGVLQEEGTSMSGEKKVFDLSAIPSGIFRLEMKAVQKDHGGADMKAESTLKFLVVKPDDKKLTAPVRRVFIPGPALVEAGEKVSVLFGSNDGPTWAVATLYGLDCKVLETKLIHLKGGAFEDISFTYKPEYPDAVRIRIFYFKYGNEVSYDRVYRKVRHSLDLPVSFSRFLDKTLPSAEYTFSVKAAPGVEALAAIYDKSLDAISRNYWEVVKASDLTISSVSINAVGGAVSGTNPYRFSPGFKPEPEDEGFPVVREEYALYDAAAPRMMKSAARGTAVGGAVNETMMLAAEAPMMMERAVAEDSAADEAAEASAEDVADAAKVTVREVFADALTFQPHLRSDADGNIDIKFSTSDKLSTYYVSVYAHGKDMRNGLVVGEMKVTVPVKVAVVEPKYLYETDSYTLGTTVSSNSETDVKGRLCLFVYPGADHEKLQPVSALVREITVPAGGSVSETFNVRPTAEDGTMGLKVVFIAGEGESQFSDAVFVPVEIKKAEQTLTEAHSAVWLHGADKEALKAALRSRFVNVDASEATYREISILDMVKEALPKKYEPDGKDAISLSETYYVQLIGEALKTGNKVLPEGSDELLKKILACRNSDGGFAWFEGMKSNRVVTAVLLERFAALRDRGFSVPDLTDAVKFLDKGQFSEAYPYWCGWVSDAQYLYVRSMYAGVPFEYKPESRTDKEHFADFKKDTKAYLVPSRKAGRGMQGYILGKARRIKTLRALAGSQEGIALAKAFGVRLSAKSRMDNSMVADLLSLVEYSVKHPDGGYYYPNAVMPYRGLLESEAYAHSLICDLLTSVGMEKNADIRSETGDDAGVIADGIRLWLMLQKETQKWEEDPGFVNAISSVLDGSEEVLATEVLVYSATYTKPFRDIKAAGNGFTVRRQFFREEKDSRKLEEIAPGTVLKRGDRIVAKYQIWNKENRSFVKLTAPREAALRPVNQLSGHVGWWLRPLLVDGWYSVSPQGYRNVLIDRTEYYFDTYPEENTTITEEFYVTQAGTFSAPVVSIESLYATHYRANDGFGGEMVTK